MTYDLRLTTSPDTVMRDDNRPKQDIINELVALRKQVADLKEASVVR